MFWKQKHKLKSWNFSRQIKGIFDTPPMPLRDAPWTMVSMVANTDMPMYLLSMKAFYRRMGGGKVVAIVDRDSPAEFRRTLSKHLPGIEFVILEDIDTGKCQRGGTWERLCYLLQRSEREYCIQVDADTLATKDDLDELVHAATINRAFTMAGFEEWGLRTMRETAAEAQAMSSDYIGIALEREFAKFRDPDQVRYIRGSSGLAGFAKGGFTMAQVEEFHSTFAAIMGERWKEWGTEQSGSNFSVANSPDPLVLPCPAYRTYDPAMQPDLSKCLHFIGTARFANGYFAAKGLAEIKVLQDGLKLAS